MKTLIVMRHAKSSWSDATLADHDRPLNKRGQADAPLMGRLILNQDLTPQLIITSTARRARSTAEKVADSCGYEGEIEATRDFFHADASSYIGYLRDVTEECSSVMVVGHNPGIEELVKEMTGQWERMPTAALALIELPIGSWFELNEETDGKLLDLWIPKGLTGRNWR